MSKPEEPKLDELKRLLRRLERIEAEKEERAVAASPRTAGRGAARSAPAASAAEATAEPQPQSIAQPVPAPAATAAARGADPKARLLGLRDPREQTAEDTGDPPALPAIIPPRPAPVAVESPTRAGGRSAPLSAIVIASATAAVVSTASAVILTLWLTGGPREPASAPQAPSQSAVETAATPATSPSSESASSTEAAAPPGPSAAPPPAEPPAVAVGAAPGETAPEAAGAAASAETSASEAAAAIEPPRPQPARPPSSEPATAPSPDAAPAVEATRPALPEPGPPPSEATVSAELPPAGNAPLAAEPPPATLPEAPPPEQQTASLDRPAEIAARTAQLLDHPEVVALPAGQATPFPVKLASGEAPAGYSLLVSGLTRGATFSRGVQIVADTWLIPVDALGDLTLTVPSGFARRLALDLELRTASGEAIASSSLIAEMGGRASAAAGLAPNDLARERESPPAVRRLIDRAELLIDNGNLRGARLLLERAAGEGSGVAAMLLGASFDPVHVAAFTPAIPEPDPAAARRWYEEARDKGMSAAEPRLTALPRP